MMTRLRRYEENVELIFKILYFLLAAGTFCPFIYDSSLQPILVKMVLGVGGILLFLRAADWKHYIRMPGLSWMALFVLSFLLSSFMNRRYGMSENFKWMIWMILQMGCLYTCKLDRSRESYEKEFRILSHVMLGYSMIAAICSFWQLLQGTALKWTTQSGEVMLSGYHWGRLWGIYTDPNYGAGFHALCTLMALYFFWNVKKWWRYIYLFPMLLSVLYIGFSDSRTSALMLCAGCGAYFLFTQIQSADKKDRTKRGIAGELMIAAAVILVFSGMYLMKKTYNQQQVPVAENTQAVDPVQKPQEIQTEREQDLQKDVSNGRIQLWKSGIEIWKTSPVYGTGYSTVVDYAKENVKGTYIIENSQGDYHNLHNQLINVLVYQGSIGVILLVGMFLYFCRYIWKAFQKSGIRNYDGMLLCSILMILIAMMFLLEGFYTNSPGACIFWVFGGYLVHGIYQDQEQTVK